LHQQNPKHTLNELERMQNHKQRVQQPRTRTSHHLLKQPQPPASRPSAAHAAFRFRLQRLYSLPLLVLLLLLTMTMLLLLLLLLLQLQLLTPHLLAAATERALLLLLQLPLPTPLLMQLGL
jgi:hypothetical protein